MTKKEFDGKKLLILGGIRLACDIVIRAQKMGAYVIVADYLEDSPAKKIADKAVLINALDVEALVEFCKQEHVDGVTTGFVDILLRPCLEVCNRLGLPCYLTPRMIDVSTNKLEFKSECNKYGIPVPQTYLVGSELTGEVKKKLHYPVFVKPLDGSGSRGAGVCFNEQDLEKQFTEASKWSSSNNAIVEDYITGREFLLNYVAQDGDFRLISMFDRYATGDRASAINYASLSFGPSKSIEFYLEHINSKVINMFKELGFKDGIFFMQGYSDQNSITFFEMGCRLGGSYYDLEHAAINCDPIEMLIRYSLSGKMSSSISQMPFNVANYKKIAVCVNFLLAGKGETIDKIIGLDKIRQMNSYVYADQCLFEGDSFQSDRIVDKPVLSVYLLVNDNNQLVNDVEFLNSVFDVFNSEGKSILKQKFNPRLL